MPAATGDPVSALILEVASKVENARAKVNLALHVIGRRADGYHLLDSLVVFAEVADTLAAPCRATRRWSSSSVDGQFADDLDRSGPTRDNLVMRAADELMAAFPKKPIRGVRLDLTKRLPIAAGLGGGSADAAAALRLLDRLWGFGASRETLAAIGLRLGADVPACLLSRPLKAEGVGERIRPVSGIPELPMILVNPRYRAPDPQRFPPAASGRADTDVAGSARLQVADRVRTMAAAQPQRPLRAGQGRGARSSAPSSRQSRPTPSACSRGCRDRAPPSSASSIRTPLRSAPPPASTPPSPPGGSAVTRTGGS